MAKKVIRGFQGLVSNPNQLDLPDGALLEADNVSLSRPGVLRPRKGVDTHSTIDVSAEYVHRLMEFGGNLYAHWDDGGGSYKLSRHDGTAWSVYAGSFAHPDGADFKLSAAELNDALYLVEGSGLRRLVDPSSPPPLAGVPRMPDPDRSNSTLTTSATGVLPKETQRAYRATVVRKTLADGAEVEGAPSGRLVLRNDSTTNSKAPTVRVLLPKWANTRTTPLTTDYWVRVYASETASLDAEPGDDLALIHEAQLTAGNIAAGYVDVADVTPDVLRGSALYTNPTQQGPLQANEPPPFARTLCNYRGCILLGSIAGRPKLELQLLAVGGTHGVQSGDLFGLDDGSGTSFTVTAGTHYTLETGGSLSASEQIRLTAQNLVSAINRHPSNTFCTASYLGNPADPRSVGLILVEHRVASDQSNVFAFVGAGSKRDCWEPALPMSPGEVYGPNDAWANGWALSKTGIGEAFPVLQNGRCWTGAIIHVAALDDAAFLFHDSGEVWMLTGEPPVDGLGSSLRMERWRTGLTLLAPSSVCEMDGALLCLTDRGVVAITPSGYRILSEPITRALSDAMENAGPELLRQQAWAVVHPSDRRYELSICEDPAKGSWRQYVYDAQADGWTTGSKNRQAGLWRTSERLLWFANGNEARRETSVYIDGDADITARIELPPFLAGDGATPKQLREVQIVFEGEQPESVALTIATEHGSGSVVVGSQGVNTLRVLVPMSLQRALRHSLSLSISARTEWRLASVVYLFQPYQERGTR